MTELFFIVGRGRSGTTLLSRMLGAHPQLAVAPEGFFAMNLRRKYAQGPWDDPRIAAFTRDLIAENRMRTWGLDLQRLTQRLHADKAQLTYAEACRQVYASYAEDTLGRPAPKWVGDKNPHYALLLETIERIFPSARYVHITRDYRDNIQSYRGLPFDLDSPAALAERWRIYNQEILQAARRAPERFLWLRFEDLVEHPEHELTRICEFLQVAFDPAMLAFHEHDPPDFYGKDSAWFGKLRTPLDASQASKRRQELEPAISRQAEAICGALGESFGYAVTPGPREPLPASVRLGVLYGYCSVRAEQLLFGWVPVGVRTRFINAYRRLTGRT